MHELLVVTLSRGRERTTTNDLLVLLLLVDRRRGRASPVANQLARVEKRIARHGLTRSAGEPVGVFMKRVATSFPGSVRELRELGELHARLEYAAGDRDRNRRQLQRFRELARRLDLEGRGSG